MMGTRWLRAACFAPLLFAGLCIVARSQRRAAASPSSASPVERRLYFGADYYFEDYSPEQVELDATAMQHAGFNLVRMLDTNWAEVEPADGRFDFTRLDRTLAVLDHHRIHAILGVPSYVPPMWLLHNHPEFMLIGQNGERYQPGGMGFVNLLDNEYLKYVQRLDEALAKHYGHDPRVVGWQIDNELGIWGAACYNPNCREAFDRYLQTKFGSIADLNRRWGTVSYGRQYSSFDEVPLDALPVGEGHQASLQFEVRRFFSKALTEFVGRQASILRRVAPQQFITHNVSSANLNINYFDLAQVLDFTSYDNYPAGWRHDRPGFELDLARGYNRGGPFLILEELSGAPGPYTLTGAQAPPGQLRLWAYQALAHGSNGVLFFRWRTARSGSEEFWQGLLDPAGQSSRRLDEIARMGAEMSRLEPALLATRVHAPVALIDSWDSWSGLEVGNAHSTYMRQLLDWHESLARTGVNIDVVAPDADFAGYRLIVAPELYVIDGALAQRLTDAVSAGAILVIGPRAATKDADNRFWIDEPPPGPLGSLTGVRVAEITLFSGKPDAGAAQGDYAPAPANLIRGSAAWPGEYSASEWADILDPTSAETLFHYTQDYYAGRPAVTLRRLGRGRVIYLGSVFDAGFRGMLVHRLLAQAQVEGPALPPPGVESVQREGARQTLLFLLNFSPRSQAVTIRGTWYELYGGASVSGKATVPAIDVRVLAKWRQRLHGGAPSRPLPQQHVR